jgi:ATP-dependent DNA helicase PIF1
MIIMLRNINEPRLCNGIRLEVKKWMNNVIKVTILKGKYKGEDIFIPRISLIPNDMPFVFKRLQFPVRLAFVISINKCHRQSLSVCGINLENPCFSHGYIYVICRLFPCQNTNKTIYLHARKQKLRMMYMIYSISLE